MFWFIPTCWDLRKTMEIIEDQLLSSSSMRHTKKDGQFSRRCRAFSPKHLWIRDMVSHSVRLSLICPQKRALLSQTSEMKWGFVALGAAEGGQWPRVKMGFKTRN